MAFKHVTPESIQENEKWWTNYRQMEPANMFLPANYEVPQGNGGSGRFFRPQDGENKVRILTDCVMGWMYWTNENKPVRLPMESKPSGTPDDIRVNDNGKLDRVKHFWSMVVYDYATEEIKIWELAQGSIQQAIAAYAQDEDWGHPRQYDLKVVREGKGLDTKYNVIASPQKPIPSEVKAAWNDAPVNLHAVFEGTDPFDAEAHSHGLDMSVADVVGQMVADAKSRGIDVKTVATQAELPTRPSEYDEAAMLRLEDALKPHLEQAQQNYDDIPF